MNILEEIALIAQSEQDEIRNFIMWGCLGAMSIILLIYAAIALYRMGSAYINRTRRNGRITQIVMSLFFIAAILYGGTKPQPAELWRFVFENGVTDNGSYCTNDQICASWTYNLAAQDYTLRAAYQDLTIINSDGVCIDELHQLPDVPVKDCSHVWIVPGATNMRVVCYATYVPPPVVFTNGVYHVSGVMRSMDDDADCEFVTPGVQIHVNLVTGESWIITPTNEPPRMPFITNQQEPNQ